MMVTRWSWQGDDGDKVKVTRWRRKGEVDKVKKVTRWRWQGAEGPQTNCLLRRPLLQFDASRISRKDWEATRWGGNCPQISGWGERLKDLRIWWDKSDKEDSWDEYEEDDMMTTNTHTQCSVRVIEDEERVDLSSPDKLFRACVGLFLPTLQPDAPGIFRKDARRTFGSRWSWSSQDDIDRHILGESVPTSVYM